MSRLARWCWSFVLTLLLIAATSASAGEGLDIQSWQSRPGVKLVAVDFFADWCVPCKAALPKWDALLAKYHERGLRLIIVTVNSKGRCLNFKPGAQKPDAVICDQEGDIAQAWGAENLPQGFLFDWHGTKMAEHADVDQVAREVESYFKNEPVVAVEDPKDDAERPLPNGLSLKKAVNAALVNQGKAFSLVADEREQLRLKTLRAKLAKDPSFAEAGACQLGEALPPNSSLSVTLSGKPGAKRLGLELFSLEKGCLLASSFVAVGPNGIDAAAQEVAYELTQSVGKVQAPSRVRPAQAALSSSSVPGCMKDTDCKGERVCEEGKCVEPKPKAVAVPVPAPNYSSPTSNGSTRKSEPAAVGDTWNDPATGLMWQVDAPVQIPWEAASMYCDALNLDGFQDWRLPSIGELRTLVRGCPNTEPGGACQVSDTCQQSECSNNKCYAPDTDWSCPDDKGPGLKGNYWPKGLKGENYTWSSTPNLAWEDGKRFFYAAFRDAQIVSANNLTSWGVRCVRGRSAPSSSAPVARELNYPTWKDPSTRLEWSVDPLIMGAWNMARDFCSVLKMNGHRDWRLPTISELRSIIRGCNKTEKRGSCAVTDKCLGEHCIESKSCECEGGKGPMNGYYGPNEIFKNIGMSEIWSSSEVDGKPDSAWDVWLYDGSVKIREKENRYSYGYCVR